MATQEPIRLKSEFSNTISEFVEDSTNDRELAKIQKIRDACSANDLDALVDLADSELGFVNDEVRKIAWLHLIGIDLEDAKESVLSSDTPVHRDEEQVKVDVNRAFIYYPKGDSDKQQTRRKAALQQLIVQVLRRHPSLHYFQGYHDVLQVFLLVLGSGKSTVHVCERLSLLRLRDFMHESISPAIAQLRLLPDILRAADATLAQHLSMTQPFFALAPTLTLYAHVIQEYSDIARLFDFVLAHEAVMPLYLFATIVCSRKKELLEFEPEEADILHSILSKLPQPLELEKLIAQTLDLYHRHPPDKLSWAARRTISAYSALQTTKDVRSLSRQSLKDGQVLFDKHAQQIQFNLKVAAFKRYAWKIRRPTAYVGLAVLFGLASWWLRGLSVEKMVSLCGRQVTSYFF